MNQNFVKNIIGNVASSYQVSLAIDIHNKIENYKILHVFTCRHWVSEMLFYILKELRNATDKNIIFACLNDGFGEISFENFFLSIYSM